MPIRYDALLVERLGREIDDRWSGAAVRSLALDIERRAARLSFRDGTSLLFLLHPTAGHILAVSGGDGFSLPGTAVQQEFRRLRLTAVETPTDERRLVLVLGSKVRDDPKALPPQYRVVAELHTNQWNLALVNARSGRVAAVLWRREMGRRSLRAGREYETPSGARPWADCAPDLDEWQTLLGSVPPHERRGVFLREVAYASAINAEAILGGAGSVADMAELRQAHGRYLSLRSAAEAAGGAWLLRRRWGAQPYPTSLGESEAEPRGSVLAAMRDAARAAGVWAPGGPSPEPVQAPAPAGDQETVRLEAALRRRAQRLERRKAALRRQLEGPDAESLRAAGSLLLARRAEVSKGASRVTLQDFDGSGREIDLEPALDPVQNAERYFAAARRRERAARRLPDEIERLEDVLGRIQAALVALPETGATDAGWDLAGGGSVAVRGGRIHATEAVEAASLPYRRYRSSGGLEIRVGRSARANDSLTFRHSAPEDIWLHARQARGAHVILRWGRREQNPSRRDLEEAAMVAAVHSEARHSGVVAVDWTRRKYVRKPRRSPPGAVVPERVRTLFVEPSAERVQALAEPL